MSTYVRSSEDTPIFRELEAKGEREGGPASELKDLVVEYWGPILRLGGLVVALNVVNYTLLTYMPTVPGTDHRFVEQPLLVVPIIGMLSMMVFLRLSGPHLRPGGP